MTAQDTSMQVTHRLLGIAVLIVLLVGLNFVVAAVDYRPYPNQDAIISEPAAHDDEQVFMFKNVETVSDTDPQAVILRETEPVVDIGLDGVTRAVTYRKEVTVDLSGATVSGEIVPGAYIQVYGQLRDESSVIDADRVVVDYQDPADYTYMYGMSILGLFVAVVYFFKHWRIDLRAGSFEPRGEQ
ncbi:MAG: hypothetical protein J07HN6_00245 [Halonotius sp. J07HN6]|nr:MAG: hypothetical protein J07HN6_00245 [Halonotius sp. J07HN6]